MNRAVHQNRVPILFAGSFELNVSRRLVSEEVDESAWTGGRVWLLSRRASVRFHFDSPTSSQLLRSDSAPAPRPPPFNETPHFSCISLAPFSSTSLPSRPPRSLLVHLAPFSSTSLPSRPPHSLLMFIAPFSCTSLPSRVHRSLLTSVPSRVHRSLLTSLPSRVHRSLLVYIALCSHRSLLMYIAPFSCTSLPSRVHRSLLTSLPSRVHRSLLTQCRVVVLW